MLAGISVTSASSKIRLVFKYKHFHLGDALKIMRIKPCAFSLGPGPRNSLSLIWFEVKGESKKNTCAINVRFVSDDFFRYNI